MPVRWIPGIPVFSHTSFPSLSSVQILTKPIVNLIVTFVGVPDIARSETRSMIKHVGLCAMMLGFMFGGDEYFMDLAQANLLSAESAV